MEITGYQSCLQRGAPETCLLDLDKLILVKVPSETVLVREADKERALLHMNHLCGPGMNMRGVDGTGLEEKQLLAYALTICSRH